MSLHTEFEPAVGSAAQSIALKPDPIAMREHLEFLFGGLEGDGLMELAWTDAKPDGAGRHALKNGQLFPLDQMDALVKRACALNATPFVNVYIGAALRGPKTPRSTRSADKHFALATALWSDLDDERANAKAAERFDACRPSMIVCTGQHPHMRQQLWWRMSESITDPARLSRLLRGLSESLDGDPSVTNPGRVMRLAGGIAWGVKEGRIDEPTFIVSLREPGAGDYGARQIEAGFPLRLPSPYSSQESLLVDRAPANTPAPAKVVDQPAEKTVHATGPFGMEIEKRTDGREGFMIKILLVKLIVFCGLNGCAPTVEELVDSAWPEYEREVDFSRPGRRLDEFVRKARYTLRRFEEGKILGLETLEAAVAAYHARTSFEPFLPPAGIALEDEDEEDAQSGVLIELPPAFQVENLPGLLGRVTQWILDTSRRPNPVMAMGAALCVLGTLMGRRVAGPTMSGTHFYVIALAGSGVGKAHALQQIPLLMRAAGCGFAIGAGKFMSETAIVNSMEREPLRICAMDEFGSFLAKINHRRASSHESGMSSFLREAWGSSFRIMNTPEWSGRKSKEIHSPALTVFGVSTPKEFYEALSGADISNGFLNRFLMLDGDMKVSDRHPPCDALKVPEKLAQELAELSTYLNQCSEEEMAAPIGAPPTGPSHFVKFDAAGEAVWKEMAAYVEERAEDPETGLFWRRTVEIALRAATVMAVGQGKFEISKADMIWARDLAYASAINMAVSVSEHMAETDRETWANRIFAFIKASPRPVSRRDIQRQVRSKIDTRTIFDIVAQMVEGRRIIEIPPPKTSNGRPRGPTYSLPLGG